MGPLPGMLGDRLTVGQTALDRFIGVRVPCPQPLPAGYAAPHTDLRLGRPWAGKGRVPPETAWSAGRHRSEVRDFVGAAVGDAVANTRRNLAATGLKC